MQVSKAISKWLGHFAKQWLDKHGLGQVADTLDADAAQNGDVDALHAMGKRAMTEGDTARAIELLQAALSRAQDTPSLYCSLGAAYRQHGDYDQAWHTYHLALALKPNYTQVLCNLGEWCLAKAQPEAALDWLDRALKIDPRMFEAKVNKTAALFELARYDQARELAQALLDDAPHQPEAHLNLGNVLMHTGKAKQAIQCYKKAIELRPGYAEAHFNLASFLGSKADQVNTIGYLERKRKSGGDSVQTLCMLASAYQASGQFEKSEQLCREVLERQPDNLAALITLGSCLSNSGDSAGSIALYDRIVEVDPSQVVMLSNRLFELNNVATVDRDYVFASHADWGAKFVPPNLTTDDFRHHDRHSQRRLRIGYISGDFVRHPVGFLLRDILRHHDAEAFEVFCFSMVIKPEEVLPELRDAADVWEEVFFLTDDELDALIRSHKIDILIDLSGHTAFNRLLALARKPAPIMAEWIGYFHSTGMAQMDYFITDPYTSPRGSGQLFTETAVHMPHTRFCYGPPEYAPEVRPAPCLKNGFVTFGTFNRLSKITDPVVDLWRSVLEAVPNSRLIVKSSALSEPLVQDRLRQRFDSVADRLDLREGSPHPEMLAEYGDMDIALDTFPFNGGLTTLEALWMGVPVATLEGNTVVSRQTYSVLANLGMEKQWAFQSTQAFIDGIGAWAADPAGLSDLRQRLRPRMQSSPLRDSQAFTRDWETLLRAMWQAWCNDSKLPGNV